MSHHAHEVVGSCPKCGMALEPRTSSRDGFSSVSVISNALGLRSARV
jgi:hypothetical protein